jgi:hypothetical protein
VTTADIAALLDWAQRNGIQVVEHERYEGSGMVGVRGTRRVFYVWGTVDGNHQGNRKYGRPTVGQALLDAFNAAVKRGEAKVLEEVVG